MQPLRFGLIGCGAQGRFLSEALALAGGAEFVACADVNPEAAALAARRCGYRATSTDYRDMLARADLDAVIVATTHDQLQPAALAAVRAGRHVFVEKPMALNAADGRVLAAAARQAGVRLMVDYTVRFMPARLLMRQLQNSGAIGEVMHISAGQLLGHLGGWLEDPARGGGPLGPSHRVWKSAVAARAAVCDAGAAHGGVYARSMARVSAGGMLGRAGGRDRVR